MRNNKKAVSPLIYSLKIQLLVCGLLSALTMLIGSNQAFSFLLGCGVFMLPNMYFTYYAFRYNGADWAPWIRLSFLKGEMGKLMLAAVGFALVFRFVSPLDEAFLFLGFGIMIGLQLWIACKIANRLQPK